MINSAKSGDTVIIPEGTYKKPIEIKKPITLKGSTINWFIVREFPSFAFLASDSIGRQTMIFQLFALFSFNCRIFLAFPGL